MSTTATAPSVHYSATEQTNLSLKSTGLSVSDVDGGSGSETLTLSVGQGILTLTAGTSGATVGGNGTSSVTISGTTAQINALLSIPEGGIGGRDQRRLRAGLHALLVELVYQCLLKQASLDEEMCEFGAQVLLCWLGAH